MRGVVCVVTRYLVCFNVYFDGFFVIPKYSFLALEGNMRADRAQEPCSASSYFPLLQALDMCVCVFAFCRKKRTSGCFICDDATQAHVRKTEIFDEMSTSRRQYCTKQPNSMAESVTQLARHGGRVLNRLTPPRKKNGPYE